MENKILTNRQQYLLDNFGLLTYYTKYGKTLVVENYDIDKSKWTQQINKTDLISADLLEGVFGDYYKITFRTDNLEEPYKTITVSKWRVLIGYWDEEATKVMCLFISTKGSDKLRSQVKNRPIIGFDCKLYVKKWDN